MKRTLSLLSFILLLCAVFIFVSCSEIEFKVDFVVDDELYATVRTNGGETIRMPTDPDKEGYIFEGWYWDLYSWNQPFTANSLLDAPLSSNMTVYAKWRSVNSLTLIGTEATFDTFEKTSDTQYYLCVPNDTETMPLDPLVSVARGSTWSLSFDVYGNQTIASRTVTLNEGDNTYYALVEAENGSKCLYTLSIRRRPMYTVEYELPRGVFAAPRRVEEGTVITPPALTRTGYDFVSWSYDFTQPIMQSQIVTTTWQAKQYTVTYDACGGTVSSPFFTATYNSSFAFAIPTKEGYIFEGWYYDSRRIQNGSNWQYDTDMTVQAQWTPMQYALNLSLGGGVLAQMPPSIYTIDSDTITIGAPTRTDYIFLGWTGTDISTPTQTITIPKGSTGHKNYTATWRYDGYEIHYVLNGGQNHASNPAGYTDSSGTITLYDPTRTGYIFGGWYTDPACTSGLEISTIPQGSVGEVTVYAKWTPISYVIVFDKNASSATGVMADQSFSYDQQQALLENAFERRGYRFVGWSLRADGIGCVYTDGETVSNLTQEAGAVVRLYAQWEACSYTVTLDKQSGTGGTGSVTAVYDAEMPAAVAPTRTGYVFKGYFTAISGGVKYYNANMTAARVWDEIDDITLYAQWEPVTVTGTLSDVLDAATHTVSFNLNGASGTAPAAQTVTDTIGLTYPTIPARSGYVFAGWYTDAACSGTPYDFTASVADDITLYAKWVDPSYSYTKVLTIGGNTGSTSFGSAIKYYPFISLVDQTITIYTSHTSGDPKIYLYNASRSQLAYNDDGYGDGDSMITYTVTAGTLYYVGFGCYGSSSGTGLLYITGTVAPDDGGIASGLMSARHTLTYGESFTLPVPTKPGFIFAGWYDGVGGTGTRYTDETGSSVRAWDKDSNATLYAKWTAEASITGTVTFDKQNGTGGTNSVTATYGSAMPTATAPTRTGYIFMGYFTAAVGGTQYYNADMTSARAFDRLEDVTLYAQWTAKTVTGTLIGAQGTVSYTVSFDLNGVGGTAPAAQTVTGTVGLTYPTVPTRSGYVFAGWYTDAACTGTPYDFSADVTNNVTLYAKWVAMTASYTKRQYVDIANYASSSAKYTFSNITSSSSSSAHYYYFTCYKTGSYTLYAAYTAGDYYISAYNVTQSSTVLSHTNFWNGGNTSKSATFSANAGDVVYVSIYKYSSSSSTGQGTFYVTGADYPTAGGIAHVTSSVTVSFDLNGASGTAPATQTVTDTVGLTYPTVPTRSGYVFAGWYTDAACTGTPYDFSADLTGSVTLYAKWVSYSGYGTLSVGGNSGNITFPARNTSNYRYYAFVPLVSGNITIYSSSSSDTYGYLFDASKTQIAYNDDGGTNNNFSITYTVNAGQLYYVVACAFSSSSSCTGTVYISGTATPTAGGVASGVVSMTQELTYGESFTLPVPTTPGFIFAGWYDGVDGTGTQYTDAAGVSIRTWDKEEDTTLYAKWTAEAAATVTVTFDKQSGTGGTDRVTATYGSAMPMATAPTRTGYTFMGYFTAAVGGTQYYNADMTSARDLDLPEDVTLYAQWTVKTVTGTLVGMQGAASHTVSFDLNGASGTAPEAQTVTATVGLTYPALPARSGYAFAGWYANAACTGDLYDFSADVTENITLYAKWVSISSSASAIVYGDNTIQIIGGSADQYFAFVALTTGTITVNVGKEAWIGLTTSVTQSGSHAYGSISYAVTAGTLYYIHLESHGQSSDSSHIGTTYLNITGQITPIAGGVATGVSFATEQLTYGESFTLPVPTNPGFIFAGWYDGVDGTGTQYTDAAGVSIRTWDKEEDTTLYAKWTAEAAATVTVTFDKQSGTGGTDSVTATYGSAMPMATAPTRTGYTFMGYFTAAVGGTQYYNADMTSARDLDLPEDVTLYAQWTAKTVIGTLNGLQGADSYTVSFDLNGAAGTAPNAQIVTASAGLTYPAIPTRSDYVFAGWYTDVACTGTPYDFSANVTGNVTLYAKWIAHSGAGVIPTNGSEYQLYVPSGSNDYYYAFVPLVTGTVSYNTVQYQNHRVELCDSSKNGTGIWSNAVSGNTTLTAGTLYYLKYSTSSSSHSITITLSAATPTAGGMISGVFTATQPLTYGESFTLPVPTNPGFIFAGWYDGVDGTGTQYTDAAGVSIRTWDKEEDTTLYAKWTAEAAATVTVTFDKQNGTGGTNSVTATYGSAMPTATAPTRTGYIFVGYFTAAVGGTQYYNADMTSAREFDLIEDITLYAQWEAVTVTGTLNDLQAPPEFTVSFDLNGADGTAPEAQLVTESVAVYYPTNPTRSGYVFTGWYLDASCTVLYNFSDDITADMTLYAGWTTCLISNTSTYAWTMSGTVLQSTNQSHGSSSVYQITAPSAMRVSFSYKVSSEQNYDYLYIKKNGSTLKSVSGSTGYVSYSVDLLAGDVLSFTYSKDGSVSHDDDCAYISGLTYTSLVSYTGTATASGAGTATEQLTYGESFTLPVPTKLGFVFEGWYDGVGGTGTQYTDATGASVRDWDKDEDVTLYAKWAAKTVTGTLTDIQGASSYTVSFDLNGAGGTVPAAQTVTGTVGLTYPTVPTRSGYVFAGWYTDAACTGTPYDFSADVTNNVTLYAKWVAMTASYTTRQYVNIANYASSSAKYTFSNITSSSSSSAHYYYFTCYKTGSYTLYAAYTAGDYYISAYNVTQSSTVLSQINFWSNGSKSTSATFSANAGDVVYVRIYKYSDSSSTGQGTFYVTGVGYPATGGIATGLSSPSHTVSFNLNGAAGTAPATQTVTDTVGLTYPTVPTRSGYVFAGWYTDAACTGTPYDFSADVTSSITLYAKWITLSSSGVGNYVIDPVTYSSSSTAYRVSISGTSSGNAVYVYFVMLKSGSYSVYYRNDSSISSQRWIYNVTTGSDIKSLGGNSSSSYYSGTFSANAGDLICVQLYLNTYSSTSYYYSIYVKDAQYPIAGGVATGVPSATQELTYGESFTLPVPTKPGFSFAGWYDGVDGTGTQYTDATGASVRVWDKDVDTTLYAKWTSSTPVTGTANVWDGTVASAYAGGNGTSSDPYVIETGAQLAYLASCVNSGTTYGSTYFRLDNDIDLNQIEWVPIGKGSANGWAYDDAWTKYFAGTFDGNGHSILNMKQSTATYGRTGLFGLVYSGTITDLCLRDASINVTNAYNNAVAGILIGTCKSATISGCAVSGTIHVSHTGDNAMAIGGMVGCLSAGTITNSMCDAVVTADATDNSYNIYAGGFVGEAIGACTISYCQFNGSVSATVAEYNVYVSGLVGIAESASTATIRNCAVTGTFSGSGVSVYADAVYYPWSSVTLSVVSCYYHATFVENTTTTNSSTYGFSTSLANLQSQSWLTANLGWDFDTVWTFVEGNDYPVLKTFFA